MQISPDIAAQLEMFRAQHLAPFGSSTDKKDAAAVSDMNSYMDSMMTLDTFQVPEVPIINTRAGLYIYLSAAVSLGKTLELNTCAVANDDMNSSWGGP